MNEKRQLQIETLKRMLAERQALYAHQPVRVMVRDLPEGERPLCRLQALGARSLATAELLALVLQTPDALNQAAEMLSAFDLPGLWKATQQELCAINGVGEALADRVQASIELGRRMMETLPDVRQRITSPGDAANLVMGEMMFLEQENLRVILLDTRNGVIATPTIYIGTINTANIRIGEIFRPALRHNAAAIIIAHNHPSHDPSPSPEDVRTTREIAQAGKLIGVDVLDHIIIGMNRYVSLKERGLGFD